MSLIVGILSLLGICALASLLLYLVFMPDDGSWWGRR